MFGGPETTAAMWQDSDSDMALVGVLEYSATRLDIATLDHQSANGVFLFPEHLLPTLRFR